MYATFETDNAAKIHLMVSLRFPLWLATVINLVLTAQDPWLDTANASDVVEWMKSTFLAHCEWPFLSLLVIRLRTDTADHRQW